MKRAAGSFLAESIARLFVVAAALAAPEALAYPEMIRHGYTSCTSCHLSPNGGGVLTAYGRGIAGEVLSSWAREREGEAAYGLVTLPEELLVGADVRFLQTYMNTPFFESARFITMQLDAEVAVSVGKWAAAVTGGRQPESAPNSPPGNQGGNFTSRRHYVLYRATDNLTLRAGKFQVAYGIPDANHTNATRRGLGWDVNSETYNLEASITSDPWEVFLTGSVGRLDDDRLPPERRETAGAVRVARVFSETLRVGASYYYGSFQGARRQVMGPFAVLGFTPKLFLLGELGFQRKVSALGVGNWSAADYLRLDYEWVQGFHTYLVQELQRANLRRPLDSSESYGFGIQWFPRPHFEFLAQYERRRFAGMGRTFGDMAWFMAHWYL